jgi:hypothetical protein
MIAAGKIIRSMSNVINTSAISNGFNMVATFPFISSLWINFFVSTLYQDEIPG